MDLFGRQRTTPFWFGKVAKTNIDIGTAKCSILTKQNVDVQNKKCGSDWQTLAKEKTKVYMHKLKCCQNTDLHSSRTYRS